MENPARENNQPAAAELFTKIFYLLLIHFIGLLIWIVAATENENVKDEKDSFKHDSKFKGLKHNA